MSGLKDFTIKAVINARDHANILTKTLVTITDFNTSTYNSTTFDESLQLTENDQGSFSFSAMQKKQGRINHVISLLVIGRELQLCYRDEYFYFVITSITPEFQKENIKYSFTCQDSISYYLSRNCVGANYSDDDDETSILWTGKTIRQLADMVLTDKSGSMWSIDPNLCVKRNGIASFPDEIYGELDTLKETTATMDLTDSNTWNGLVEIANIFGAYIYVKYPEDPNEKRIIYFKNKKLAANSYYKLNQNFNLNKLNLSQSSDDYCSVLWVTGGTKSDDSIVGLIPPMSAQIQAELDDIIIRQGGDITIGEFGNTYENNSFEKVINRLKWSNRIFEGYSHPTNPGTVSSRPFTISTQDKGKFIFKNCVSSVKYKVGNNDEKDVSTSSLPIELKVEDLLDENDSVSLQFTEIKYTGTIKWELDIFEDLPIFSSVQWNRDSIVYINALKAIPSCSGMLYNFDYLYESGIIDAETLRELKFELGCRYRDQNIIISRYADAYYNLLRSYQRQLTEEEQYVSEIAADNEAMLTHLYEGGQSSDEVMRQVPTTGDGETYETSAFDENGSISTTSQNYILETTTKLAEWQTNVSTVNSALWNLWASGSSVSDSEGHKDPMGYMEAQIHYSGNDFITNRINEQIDKRLKYYTECYACWEKALPYLFSVQLTDSTNGASLSYDKVTIDNIMVKADKVTDSTLSDNRDKYYVLRYSGTLDENNGFADQLQKLERNLSQRSRSAYVSYCTLKAKIERYELYLDKVHYDSDQHKVWRGICSIYIDNLTKLQTYVTMNNDAYNQLDDIYKVYRDEYKTWTSKDSQGYLAHYNNAIDKRDVIWTNLVKKYPECFIEGYYSDEDQLTSSGLYKAALTQFTQYNQPKNSYSLTMIDWEASLDHGIKNIHVGDKLTISHDNLELFYTRQSKTTQHFVEFEVDKYVDGLPRYINSDKFTETLNMKVINSRSLQGRYFITIMFTFDSGVKPFIDYSFVRILKSTKSSYNVLSYNIIHNSQDIELQVTGISKNLREDTTELTVSNEGGLNSVVQKMLMSVRAF